MRFLAQQTHETPRPCIVAISRSIQNICSTPARQISNSDSQGCKANFSPFLKYICKFFQNFRSSSALQNQIPIGSRATGKQFKCMHGSHVVHREQRIRGRKFHAWSTPRHRAITVRCEKGRKVTLFEKAHIAQISKLCVYRHFDPNEMHPRSRMATFIRPQPQESVSSVVVSSLHARTYIQWHPHRYRRDSNSSFSFVQLDHPREEPPSLKLQIL